MSCDCSGCQRSKRIGELRAKQPEGSCRKLVHPVRKHPTSKKILVDRYQSARRSLLQQIEWYKRDYERRNEPRTIYHGYVDWFREPIKRNSWGVKKYREARALCKAAGISV